MISSLYKIGTTHKTNEDAQYYLDTTERSYLCVMDGCSGGEDSVFCSYLLKKIIKQILNTIVESKIQFYNLFDESKYIFKNIHSELFKFKELLNLNICELESTIGIAIIDKENNIANITFAGDGIYSIDDNIVSIDQNNCPNYISHYNNFDHLMDSLITDNYKFNEQISISTDGLESFSDGRYKYDMVEHFIKNKSYNNPSMLTKKLNKLTKGFEVEYPKMFNEDDISLLIYSK